MANRKIPTHKSFESFNAHGKFTKIVDDMMDSAAWHALEPSQMGLYLLLKRKYTKSNTGDFNQLNISMPHSEYQQIKTYSNRRIFWRDLDALIEFGFIIVSQHGKNTRTPNIYGFSDAWKRYGTPDFNVESRHKRKNRKDKPKLKPDVKAISEVSKDGNITAVAIIAPIEPVNDVGSDKNTLYRGRI